MATQTNDWSLYNLYPPNGGIGGIWKQPIAGGLVYPQQVRASSDYLSIKPFTELSGTFIGSCGHSFDQVYVVREFDAICNVSVALICCNLCGCVQSAVSPFEDALMGNTGALIYATLYPGAGGYVPGNCAG